MGFSNLLKEKSLEEIESKHISWFKKVLALSLGIKINNESLPTINDFKKNEYLNLIWFSDTILIFTKEDRQKNIVELIQFIQHLIFYSLYEGNMKARVGVSYGEISYDMENNLLWGLPIVIANKLQEYQNWTGGALDDMAIKRISQEPIWEVNYSKMITKYKIPLKKEAINAEYAIDWTIGVFPLGFQLLYKDYAKNVSIESSDHIKDMYENTMQFYENTSKCSIRK